MAKGQRKKKSESIKLDPTIEPHIHHKNLTKGLEKTLEHHKETPKEAKPKAERKPKAPKAETVKTENKKRRRT